MPAIAYDQCPPYSGHGDECTAAHGRWSRWWCTVRCFCPCHEHSPTAGRLPGDPKPAGETRPGDLRYNILVRLGNLGCPHDVDELSTEEMREHWRSHLR